MLLLPREQDKLLLSNAGFLAQRRLARGVRLNSSEATALICCVLLELVRDGRGHSVSSLSSLGSRLLGTRHVLPSVSFMLDEVQLEGTFPDGTKLITVHQPISTVEGDLKMALYGSFLPIPDTSLFDPESNPGEITSPNVAVTFVPGNPGALASR